jgi:hypothetical protein
MQIDDVSKDFLHVPNNYAQWILFFSNILFPIKCAPFLLKIGEDVNIDNYF